LTLIAALLLGAAIAAEYSPSPPVDGKSQLTLERLNALRADPPAYMDAYRAILADPMARGDCDEGAEILTPLADYTPRPPLAPHPALTRAARAHAQDMVTRDYFAHVSPEGIGPNARVRAEGYPLDATVRSDGAIWSYGDAPSDNQTESLFQTERWSTGYAPYLSGDQWSHAVDNLIADACVPGRGHRDHLLGNNPLSALDQLVGIGWAVDRAPDAAGWQGWKLALAIETAVQSDRRSRYVLGVIWEDRDGDGAYDPGEGLPGVQVSSPELGLWTRTAEGGGYVLPARRGDAGTVQAWGRTAAFGAGPDNVKIDVRLDVPAPVRRAALSVPDVGVAVGLQHQH